MRTAFILLLIVSAVTGAWAEPASRPVEPDLKYQSWATHQPGTAVTIKCVNEGPRGSNEIELRYVLKQVTPTHVLVETTMTAIRGRERLVLDTSSNQIDAAKAADTSKPRVVGTEDLVVDGKTYTTTHYAFEPTSINGRATSSEIWESIYVPGANVKLEITSGEGPTMVKSHFIMTKIELK